MKQCPKCGKEYGDDMLFCAECGEKLAEEQIRFCRNCGEKIRAGAAKCPKCGADLGVKKAETTEVQIRSLDIPTVNRNMLDDVLSEAWRISQLGM